MCTGVLNKVNKKVYVWNSLTVPESKCVMYVAAIWDIKFHD